MRHRDHFFHRVDRAECVRGVADGNDARALGEQLREFIDDHFAAVVDRRDDELRVLAFAEQLPRHDVRVMFDRRDQHFIAGTDVDETVRLRDEVDRFGRAAREDDFFFIARVDESLHRRARAFVCRGGDFAEIVHAAMDVRIFLRVIANDPIDHRLRLLRRRRVVEIDERLAADMPVENWKVFTNRMNVESLGNTCDLRSATCDLTHRSTPRSSGSRSGSCWNIERRICSRTTSALMRSTISLANACTRRPRASSSPTPRERR